MFVIVGVQKLIQVRLRGYTHFNQALFDLRVGISLRNTDFDFNRRVFTTFKHAYNLLIVERGIQDIGASMDRSFILCKANEKLEKRTIIDNSFLFQSIGQLPYLGIRFHHKRVLGIFFDQREHIVCRKNRDCRKQQ